MNMNSLSSSLGKYRSVGMDLSRQFAQFTLKPSPSVANNMIWSSAIFIKSIPKNTNQPRYEYLRHSNRIEDKHFGNCCDICL